MAGTMVGGCPAPSGGPVGLIDFVTVLQCALGQIDPVACPDTLAACDVNCDGVVNGCDFAHTVALFAGTPSACTIPCGACCDPKDALGALGVCAVATQAMCESAPENGTYLGDDTTCQGDGDTDGRDDACACTIDPDCDNADVCTTDTCDPVGGVCRHAVIPVCPDCDLNGVADAQDLANCPPGVASCDDCNASGQLDVCDITSGLSLDADGNGVPDECVAATALTTDWTDPNLWLSLGGGFPDNAGPDAGLTPTLPTGATVNLNQSIEIDGLRIDSGAVLHFPPPVIPPPPMPAPIALTIGQTAPGGLQIGGLLDVGAEPDVVISVAGGTVTIFETGRYAADSPGAGRSTLTARDIVLTAMAAACRPTDQMLLTDRMLVTTSADFVLDGRNATRCPPPGSGQTAVSLGFRSPPVMNLRPAETALSAGRALSGVPSAITQLVVNGSLRILNIAEICVGCDAPENALRATVELRRDFDNRSLFPSLFDWSRGKLTLLGTRIPQIFEVAGLDLGPTPGGFNTNVVTLADDQPHGNFSMGTVEVAANVTVRFVNNEMNTASDGVEALYVNHLILQPGSTVILSDSNVYYCLLEDNGGTIVLGGTGQLLSACNIPAVSFWGAALLSILLVAAGGVVLKRRAPGRDCRSSIGDGLSAAAHGSSPPGCL
ncbi:MAG: hypothetical protein ACE5EX_04250 [Phycisphaerae bacterium]